MQCRTIPRQRDWLSKSEYSLKREIGYNKALFKENSTQFTIHNKNDQYGRRLLILGMKESLDLLIIHVPKFSNYYRPFGNI